MPEGALPMLTWQVLSKLPQIIPVWGVFLGGMYWLTIRKREVIRHEAKEAHHG